MVTYRAAFTEAVGHFRVYVRYIKRWGNFAWEHKPPEIQKQNTQKFTRIPEEQDHSMCF